MKNFLFILFLICSSCNVWGQCPARPDAKFDIGSNDVCEGIPITFTNTTITNNNSLRYEWTWGDGSPVTANNSTTVTHVFNLSTTQACGITAFDVRLDAININTNCLSHYIIKPVYVNKQPVAAFSAPQVCLPDPTPFTNTTCPNSSANVPTYNWSFGEPSSGLNNSSIIESPSHTYASAGTYTVVLSVSGLGCATSTAIHQVQVFQAPVAQASFTQNPNTGCIPLNLNFTNTSTPNNNTHAWTSSPSIAFLPLPSVQNPTALIITAGTYTVTLTESNQCGSSTTTQTITAIKKPSFSPLQIPAACAPFTNNLSLSNLDMGGTSSVTYNWAVSSPNVIITNSSSGTPTISGNTAGTYTVTVTVGNTCGTVSSTASFIVSTQGGLTISLPSAVPCAGGTPIQLTANTPGGVWSGCANIQGQVTPTVGSCNVTYTVSTGACSGSTSTTVVVNPPPTPSVNAPPICVGSALNLSANGGSSYSWVGPNNYMSSAQNPSLPNAAQMMSGIYTVTVTNIEGCTATATVNAVINVIPIITTSSPITACNTASAFQLQATTNPSGTIVWSGANITNTGVFNAQAANIGNHTVTATTTVNNCSSSTAVTINVTANAVANAGADQTVCPQSAVINLDAQTGVTGGGIWTVSPPTSALNGSNFTPNQATAGQTYTFNLVLNGNDPNCRTQDSKTISIQNLPQPIITTNPACEGSNLSLNVNNFASYAWVGPNTFASIVQNPVRPSASSTMAGTYTVTVTDGNGCTNSTTANIIINGLPILTLTPLSICQNNNQPFLLTATAPATGVFVWSGTGVTAPNSFNANQNVGTYTVSCTVTDANTCSRSGTTTVEITANIQPSITTVAPICANAAIIQLVGIPLGGTWTGAGVSGTTNTDFTPSLAQIGNNTITYTVNASNSTCVKTTTAVINVLPIPQIVAQDTAACIGTQVRVYATTSNAATVSITGYSWTGPNFTSSSQNAQVTTSAASTNGGIYTVVATGSNTCTASKTITVTINNLPIVTATPMTICRNNIQLFTLNMGLPNSGGTGVWAAGVTGLALTPPDKFDANQAVGLYPVIYTFTDANSCKNTANTTVEITANSAPIITPVPDACLNTASINLLTSGAPTGGTWTGNGVDSNTGSFTAANAAVGQVVLTYTLNPNDPVCKISTNDTLNIKPLPNLTLTSNTPCAKDTLRFSLIITGSPMGSTYSWTGPNSFTSSVKNPFIANVQSNAVGIYMVTVTGDNSCTNIASNQTMVYGLPNTQSNDTSFCRTAGCYNLPFVSISDSLGTFVWSSYDAGNAISTIPPPACFKPLISGTGAFHAVVTLTDSHGCIGRDTVIITITEPAVLSVSPRRDTACQGETIVLHGYPVGGKWYRRSVGFPDPSIVNDSTVNTVILIGGGSFEYIYSLGDGSCNVKDSVKLFVVSLDSISAGVNDSFCISYAPFQLIGQTPINYTPTTAHWENAHTNVAGQYIQNQGITSTGFYTPYSVAGADSSQVIVDTVKFVYTDPINNCKVTRTKIITIHPLPIPSNTIPNVGCIGVPITFTNTSPNIATSIWTFGDGSTSTDFSPTHSYVNTGLYNINLVVTSNFGCRAAVNDTIRIVAPPYIGFTMSADTICAGLPVTMTNLSGGYQVSYIWDYGDGTPQDNVFAPPPHRFAQAECDTTYRVILTASNLCKTLYDTSYILVRPLPVPKWDLSQDNICSGDFISFSNRTKGCNTKSYHWDLGDGSTSTDSIPASRRYFTDSLPRNYTICLQATGICGNGTLCRTINVKPVSVKAFSIADRDRGCRPLSINFRDFSTSTDSMDFTYTWDFGDGFTSTSANPNHVFDTSGTFIVRCYVSNGCGFAVDSIRITVFPQPRIGFTHPPYQCAKQNMLFTNTSQDPISSRWVFDDATSSLATNPAHAFVQAGNHLVTLIGTSLLNGCPDTTRQIVLIRANPLLTPTVDNSDGCGPLKVRFTTAGAPSGFDYYYTWDFGDGGSLVDTAHVAIAQTVEHIYTQRDMITRFNVGLSVIDQYQCKSDTLYSPIVLYPTPTAAFEYSINPKCGVDVLVNFINKSSSTAGNLRYEWQFGDGDKDNNDSPTHTYQSSSGRIVTLTATNTYMCADSVQQRLAYCDGLFIPSAFSPETGLGEVRLFGAKGLGIKEYRLSVYSRFGNLIWTTDKLEQGLPVERWDGMFEGTIVPQDMYIWKCDAVFENGEIWQGQEDANGTKQRVGTVTVLR